MKIQRLVGKEFNRRCQGDIHVIDTSATVGAKTRVEGLVDDYSKKEKPTEHVSTFDKKISV